MSKNYFTPGEWNFTCDSCGQKLKSSKGRKRWDGFMVCHECWEPRHSQDFVRAKVDRQSLPWARAKAPDVFVPLAVQWLQDEVVPTDSISGYRLLQRTILDTHDTYGESLTYATMKSPGIDTATTSETISRAMSLARTLVDSQSVSDNLYYALYTNQYNGAPINTLTLG